MKSHKPKLVGKLLRHIQTHECLYCLLDQDTAPAYICRNCHDKFKRMLSSTSWTRHRRSFLATAEHSYCSHCYINRKVMVVATVVDHIMPWSMHPTLFWHEDNHQALCTGCHANKTANDGSYRYDNRLFKKRSD